MLELLVAMAVFSLLIVMLMGMVDSGTKLWRDNENRVDSYREARAAINMMSRDLRNTLPATNSGYFLINTNAFTKIPGSEVQRDTNSAGAVFFLSVQPSFAQDASGNKSDICEVGYFLAYGNTSLVPTGDKSMNLYRYFRSSDSTFSNLVTGPSALFDTGGITGDRTDLLARNVKSFRITPYHIGTNGNPVAYDTANGPLPDFLEISITALNQDTSKKLNSVNDWTNQSGNLAKVVGQVEQTFTTRVHIDRP